MKGNQQTLQILLITLLSSLLLMGKTLALELDEKLTTRLLKVSKSKKTILLNRGLEDGLVVGDHASHYRYGGTGSGGEMFSHQVHLVCLSSN